MIDGPAEVWYWDNGLVTTFTTDGDQIPPLQGLITPGLVARLTLAAWVFEANTVTPTRWARGAVGGGLLVVSRGTWYDVAVAGEALAAL